MQDTQTLHKIQSGDVKAFESVFADFYEQLCLYTYKYVRDSDDAEEIVQEMFVKFWNKRKDLSITSSLKSYLYQSVKNASLNRMKHLKVVREHEEYQTYHHKQSEDSADIMVEAELNDKIRESMEKLPPERKKIFLMSRNENLKYKEIAEKLNISVKTVENQMGKALKFLRVELAEFLTISSLILADILKRFWE